MWIFLCLWTSATENDRGKTSPRCINYSSVEFTMQILKIHLLDILPVSKRCLNCIVPMYPSYIMQNIGLSLCKWFLGILMNIHLWNLKKMKSLWLWKVATWRPTNWGSWGKRAAKSRPMLWPRRVVKLLRITSGECSVGSFPRLCKRFFFQYLYSHNVHIFQIHPLSELNFCLKNEEFLIWIIIKHIDTTLKHSVWDLYILGILNKL